MAKEMTREERPMAAPPAAMRVHIVKQGENLSRIAANYKVTLDALKKVNPHLGPPKRDWNKIKPSERVNIPTR
jgi:LysM repeat protein